MDNVFTQIHQYSFKNKFVAQYFSTFVIKKLINPTNSRFLYHIKLGGLLEPLHKTFLPYSNDLIFGKVVQKHVLYLLT